VAAGCGGRGNRPAPRTRNHGGAGADTCIRRGGHAGFAGGTACRVSASGSAAPGPVRRNPGRWRAAGDEPVAARAGRNHRRDARVRQPGRERARRTVASPHGGAARTGRHGRRPALERADGPAPPRLRPGPGLLTWLLHPSSPGALMKPAPARITGQARPWLLALACLLALPARADDGDAARLKALALARSELADAARRVAELSQVAAGSALALESRLDEGARQPRLGVLLGVDPEAGVRIAGVTPGGGAAKAGLRSGDRLLRINGKAIGGSTGEARVEAARKALATLEAGKAVTLAYVRDGREQSVEVVPAPMGPRVMVHQIGRDGPVHVRELQRLQAGAPGLRSEVLRLSQPGACSGEDCT